MDIVFTVNGKEINVLDLLNTITLRLKDQVRQEMAESYKERIAEGLENEITKYQGIVNKLRELQENMERELEKKCRDIFGEDLE